MIEKSPPHGGSGGVFNDPEEDDDPRTGHVWTLKKGAKVASGTDVHTRALVRRAEMLERQGFGGGIVSLLLPKTETGRRRLSHDRDLYQLRRVRPRSTGERGRARDPQLIGDFLFACLMLKESPNPAWTSEQFLIWVIEALRDQTSPIYKLAKANFSLLVEHPRSLRWWQHRLTELRRMSR